MAEPLAPTTLVTFDELLRSKGSENAMLDARASEGYNLRWVRIFSMSLGWSIKALPG